MQLVKAPAIVAWLAPTLLLLALSATPGAAQGVDTTLSGYGTVGGSFTSDPSYAYRHDVSEFKGASRDFDIGLDSRFGVQAVFDFSPQLSVTIQEVARDRGNKSFDPGTEWFYAQYLPDSHWTLRVGRVALGTFLLSDMRLVGYSVPWFQAPNEVYGYEPFQYVDGGQVLWHQRIGPVGVTLQSSYGTTEAHEFALATTFDALAHDVSNASMSLEFRSFLFRVSQTRFTLPTPLPLSPTTSIVYEEHDKFTSVGLQYDDGRALILSEWTSRAENAAPFANLPLIAGQAWYIAGGWRFGKLTPMVMLANSKPKVSLLVPAGSFTSESLTLRYDLIHNVALKAQVTRASAGNFWYWTVADPSSNRYVEVFALGADFLF